MEKLKELLASELEKNLSVKISKDEILLLIERPKYSEQGDLAFPCFSLAKELKKAPQLIANELAEKISEPIFERVVDRKSVV